LIELKKLAARGTLDVPGKGGDFEILPRIAGGGFIVLCREAEVDWVEIHIRRKIFCNLFCKF
jgi:hypothetical protein